MYLFQNPLIRFGLSIFGLSNLEILLASHADYQAIKLIKTLLYHVGQVSRRDLCYEVGQISTSNLYIKLVRFQLAIYI